MIRHLIWDLDGTLLDTYPAIVGAIVSSLDELGVVVSPREVEYLCKVSFAHCLEFIIETYPVSPEPFLRLYWSRRDEFPLYKQVPFPGTKQLCEYALSVGGCNTILTHRDRMSLGALLETHGLDDMFVDAVAGDDGFPRKPDPAGLLSLVERNRIPLSEVLLIGDRDLDVQAAQNAGVRACFFGSGPRTVAAEYAVTEYGLLLEQIMSSNQAFGPGAW